MSAFEADRFNHSRTSPGAKHWGLLVVLRSPLAEKRLQQLRTPTGQNSRLDFDVMILSRMVQDLHYRPIGPRFRVFRSINYATDSGVNHSPRAHRARLNCNKRGAAA